MRLRAVVVFRVIGGMQVSDALAGRATGAVAATGIRYSALVRRLEASGSEVHRIPVLDLNARVWHGSCAENWHELFMETCDSSLTEDIRGNGIQHPILIDVGTKHTPPFIADGHHRLIAAWRAGIDTVPVRFVDTKTLTTPSRSKTKNALRYITGTTPTKDTQ